jgi:DNA repair protein RecO (recombination protein O)
LNKDIYDGYVLHRRPYRETSLIVDFFTLQNGRVSAMVKGARRPKSDKKSLLQPLQAVNFELVGRGTLRNLSRIESTSRSYSLSQQSLFCVFYLNEVLNRALPESEPFTRLFQQYELSLNTLQQLSIEGGELVDIEPILRNFEFVLLEELGYFPDFTYDSQNELEIVADKSYSLMNEIGFVQCDQHLSSAISGQDILAINNNDWQSSSLKAAKKISRIALHPILGDKPIKSRELFSTKITI